MCQVVNVDCIVIREYNAAQINPADVIAGEVVIIIIICHLGKKRKRKIELNKMNKGREYETYLEC